MSILVRVGDIVLYRDAPDKEFPAIVESIRDDIAELCYFIKGRTHYSLSRKGENVYEWRPRDTGFTGNPDKARDTEFSNKFTPT